MEAVLNERHKRAEGARADAEATLVVVHEKQRAYANSLKKARTEIFTEQEAQRRLALEERQAKINQARAVAQAALQEAKKGIAADVQAAKAELEQSSGSLANEIADAVLAGLASAPGGKGGR